MSVLATMMYAAAFLTEGGANSLSGILQLATELLTWVITSMGSVLSFITSNPLILIFMIFGIVGFVVGFLLRIWHGVG